jgi:predicted DNA-binding protein (UPF0251 family)
MVICQVFLNYGIIITMGREKLKRKLQFKPRCKTFTTTECNNEEVIHLLHEEMESLYLMDAKELYQADAAKEMEVSRPTFARILKSARQKITMMLITGANLKIEDKKDDFIVMIPSEEKSKINNSIPIAQYLHIYEIQKNKIIRKEIIENPVFQQKSRPGQILPALCNQKSINFFIAEVVGEGLKSALLSKGIYSYPTKNISEENICTLVK